MTRIEEIAARAEAATPGPWEWLNGDSPMGLVNTSLPDRGYEDPILFANRIYDLCEISVSAANREFIAKARDDIPWLLNAVRVLLPVADVYLNAFTDDDTVSVTEALRLTEVRDLVAELDSPAPQAKEAE